MIIILFDDTVRLQSNLINKCISRLIYSKMDIPIEDFNFPYPPYHIQEDFMRNLYHTIEQCQYGIFESPTGTGKSLSILCGALKWLEDHKRQELENIEVKIHALKKDKAQIDNGDDNDWISTQSQVIAINQQIQALNIEGNKVQEYYKKIEDMKARKAAAKKRFSAKAKSSENKENITDEKPHDDDECLINEVEEQSDVEDDKNDDDSKYQPTKIIICSRTHSQLAQLVGEINKTKYAGAIRCVALGSRGNFCINPAVKKLKNVQLINEKCLELQRNKSSKPTKQEASGSAMKKQRCGFTCSCIYYKQNTIDDLSVDILFNLQDVEDVVASSKEFQACGYYASRKAVEDAELVLVPYNTLLHEATRQANGLRLKNNVVIIDEAHNLLEALCQMYNCEINSEQLRDAQMQLKAYKDRYNLLFSAKNLLSINQLITILGRLFKVLDADGESKTYKVVDFIYDCDLEVYNFSALIKFIKDSKLAQKLYSYAIKASKMQPSQPAPKKGVKAFLQQLQQPPAANQIPSTSTNTTTSEPSKTNQFLSVTRFLEVLTYQKLKDEEALIIRDGNRFEFLILNAAPFFMDVVSESRSVIVAGGTMQPLDEFRKRLFAAAGAPSMKIVSHAYNHVVPARNIVAIALTHAKRNIEFCFTRDKRNEMCDDLTAVIKEACRFVRGGIVVFFPSYNYEELYFKSVKDVDFRRQLFREPRGGADGVDAVLTAYQAAITKSKRKSALMFSVVGGKLSEGLNFSDDLGRCVIVVGLPYANPKAANLQAKMQYLDKNEAAGAGQRFYHNLCMKAVNQCIGRSVRHRNDFASVLLVDNRYNRPDIQASLPNFIRCSLSSCKFDECFKLIDEFCTEHGCKVTSN